MTTAIQKKTAQLSSVEMALNDAGETEGQRVASGPAYVRALHRAVLPAQTGRELLALQDEVAASNATNDLELDRLETPDEVAVRQAAAVEILWNRTQGYRRYCGGRGLNPSPETNTSYRTGILLFLSWVAQGYVLTGKDARIWDLARLDRSHANAYLTLLSGNCAIATVRSRLAALSAFFNAMCWTHACRNNPFAGLKPGGNEPVGRHPYTEDEVATLLDYCEEHGLVETYAIIVILSSWGLRITSALSLQWSQLKNGTVALIKTKGRKTISQPVEGPVLKAAEILRAHRIESAKPIEGDVFTIEPHAFRKRLRSLCEETAVEYKPPHCFRHKSITDVYEATNATVAQHFAGHASPATTQPYTHVDFLKPITEYLKKQTIPTHKKAQTIEIVVEKPKAKAKAKAKTKAKTAPVVTIEAHCEVVSSDEILKNPAWAADLCEQVAAQKGIVSATILNEVVRRYLEPVKRTVHPRPNVNIGTLKRAIETTVGFYIDELALAAAVENLGIAIDRQTFCWDPKSREDNPVPRNLGLERRSYVARYLELGGDPERIYWT